MTSVELRPVLRALTPCSALALLLNAACGDPDDPDNRTVIEGALVEALTGRPVVGQVSGFPELGMVATSSPGGTFRFDGAGYGTRYRLIANAMGYLEAELSVVPRFGVPTEVTLELTPAVACAAGQRRCARGGLEGVEVCTPDGRGFRLEPCSSGLVCEPASATCMGAPQVRVSVDGSGSVVSNPSGILCNPTCERRFTIGTELSLEARSFGDSEFQGWSGACSGNDPTCSLNLQSDLEVQARFQTTAYRLSVDTRGGAGSVRSMPDGIDCGTRCQSFFDANQTVTLVATPGDGRVFQRWDLDCSGSAATCSLTMSQARQVRARFQAPGIPVEVEKLGLGAGTVRSDPAGIDCGEECVAGFRANQSVTLTAEAAPGSLFAGWGGDCAAFGTDETCTRTVDAPQMVTARFDGDTTELAVTIAGGGAGDVRSDPAGIACGTDCSARFPRGSMVALDVTPAPDAVFFEWSGACASAGREATCTVQLDQDLAAEARFEPFYLAPLGADAACETRLGFEPPAPLAVDCGGLETPQAPGWTSVPSRSALLGQSYEPPTPPTPLDLGRVGPASAPATVELSARVASGRSATLFSDHDRRDPARAGLDLRVLADGRVAASTFDGLGGSTSATTAVGTLSGGAWAHVAVVLESTSLAIFIDGVESARTSATLRLARSSSTAWVGAARTGTVAADGLSGAVDEIRISNQARY